MLIAIDVLGIDVNRCLPNLGDAAERAAHLARWPSGKMPLLMDGQRPVPESSVIIEYLQQHHARSGHRLIPDDTEAALDVRLWDRLFDLYVMTPMQALTADLLRPEHERDPTGVAQARAGLSSALGWIDRHLDGRTWVTGEAFSMADCAAAPALFYAVTYVPVLPQQRDLAAYVDRVMDHPPVATTIDLASPYFKFYPGCSGLARRYFEPDSD